MHRFIRRTLGALALTTAPLSVHAQLPEGMVAAWHEQFPGTPTLSAGWTPLDGGLVTDPSSPYFGQSMPTWNLDGRFLRGASLSGLLQDDAFQGHHHDIAHTAQEIRSGPSIWDGTIFSQRDRPNLASVLVLDPISDGVNGTPRTASETRPKNMAVRWIMKTGRTPLPIGSIVAWHRDFSSLLDLPQGWVPCDGRTVLSPTSPYLGLSVPDLNGTARFLRGGLVSGAVQDDAFQGHHHDVTHNADVIQNGFDFSTRSAWEDNPASFHVGEPISDGVHGTPRTADETRPVNTSVMLLLKVEHGPLPAGAILAWHRDFPSTPALAPGWFPCDGSTLTRPGTPFHGRVLPNLNAPQHFLRGGLSSGVSQSDAFQGHHHDVNTFASTLQSGGLLGGQSGSPDWMFIPATVLVLDPITDGLNGTPRVADETRPKNASVIWTIYLPDERAGPHYYPTFGPPSGGVGIKRP